MTSSALTAISPLDGRYQSKTKDLGAIFSEFALIRNRLIVEVEWFKSLCASKDLNDIPALSQAAIKHLDDLVSNFSVSDAEQVKSIEAKTNHDVKAVEYFIKESFSTNPELNALSEIVHFACTSEDINNVAYALMLKQGREYCLSQHSTLLDAITQLAHQTADLAMLSRTHGQAATPTTLGKELANVVARAERQVDALSNVKLTAKMNGAVGNYNAHLVAFPNYDWPAHSKALIENLGLTWNAYTTQIEPHDGVAELCDALARANHIFIDFARDVWGYISLGYFTQSVVDNEVGSSTMPHKVNPIDFENAEGNLAMANAIFKTLSAELPISRWQRDLSDSTLLRNLGVGFAHTHIAHLSLQKGIGKLKPNESRIQEDLNNNWEVLTEALQTVMRLHNIENPYEQLKALSRGKTLNQEALHTFIDTLGLPDPTKKALKQLTPENYIGLAAQLAKQK